MMDWTSNDQAGHRTAAGSCGASDGAHIWRCTRPGELRLRSRLLTARTPSIMACSRPMGHGCSLSRSDSRGPRGTSISRPSKPRAPASRRSWATGEASRTRTGRPARPTGRRIAFETDPRGNKEIYTVAADGADPGPLDASPGLDAHPCWSPDGKTVAFATDRWGAWRLAAVGHAGDSGLVRLHGPGLDDYQGIPRRDAARLYRQHR